jgi:hypothetical protein
MRHELGAGSLCSHAAGTTLGRMQREPNDRTRKLSTGAEIPRVGLGVFQAPRGEVTRAAVRAAIELGYRHIDTARVSPRDQP